MKRKPNNLRSLIALLAMLPLMGCHLQPDLGPPGTIGHQRSRHTVHDPFPDNDLGPPIHGGRPRGFDRPLAETQNLQRTPNVRRGSPVPNYQGF